MVDDRPKAASATEPPLFVMKEEQPFEFWTLDCLLGF